MNTPTLARIRSIHETLKPYVIKTPVLPVTSSEICAELGTEVVLKLELMQRTGTFKYRGALNNLLNRADLDAGITAVSAGNHAVATACAASQLGVDAKVVMQASANPARRALAASYGAELIFENTGAEAFATAERLVQEEARAMIHPFDGAYVAEATAGVGLEFIEDAPDLDAVVVSVGGGGLIGGVACAVKQLRPGCAVYGIEPEGASGMLQSLRKGRALEQVEFNTVADSLGPPMTTPYTYEMTRQFVDEVVTVSDDEILRAVYTTFSELKLAVEPAGATALAGALGPLRRVLRGKKVGLLVCGSCIDAKTFAGLLAQGQALQSR